MAYEQFSDDHSSTEWSDDSSTEESEDGNQSTPLSNVSITTSTVFSSSSVLLAQGVGLASMINHATQGLWGTPLPSDSFEYFSSEANSIIQSSTGNFDYQVHLHEENGILSSTSDGITSYHAFLGKQLAIIISINNLLELVGISFENLHIVIDQTTEAKEFTKPISKDSFKGDAATPLMLASNLIENETLNFEIIKKQGKYRKEVSERFDLISMEIILFLMWEAELTRKSR